jgi:3-deoxy-manno-octulosonate cytidylyltransferase (CMP-KDO synthetase)
MTSQFKIGIVIPARIASVRLPGKPLLEIFGLPMIEHVRRRAMLSLLPNNVIVASGDVEIISVVEAYGGTATKSIQEHANGLSRVAEAANHLDFSHVIVLQGDEILMLPKQLNSLISMISTYPEVDFWNGICSLESADELDDASVVKCTLKTNQCIQTMFRKTPLTSSISTQMSLVKKINGLFAISKDFLTEVVKQSSTPIEVAESIEQMKILELSKDITTFDMEKNYPSINLPKDVDKVIEVLTCDPEQIEILSQVKNW